MQSIAFIDINQVFFSFLLFYAYFCTKNHQMDEIFNIFKQNFPFVSREDDTIRRIISHPDNLILRRHSPEGRLIACAIVNQNTILLLVVDKPHRCQGIGSQLLKDCEESIQRNGHQKVILGVGFDYLMPGVPTSRRYAPSVNERLDPLVNTSASDFFEHRGYLHAWGECNCFDMKMQLADFLPYDHQIGDIIDGIHYRWATPEDLEGIVVCADDACQYQDESFSKYYRNPELYQPDGQERVLIAEQAGRIVGTLIVCVETEAPDTGNVGCTCVATDMTHQRIATTMVRLGTRHLKTLGLTKASLSYTYSNLDTLYGVSGYHISTYYFMGEKAI